MWWSCRPSGTLTQLVAAVLVLGDLGLYTISFNPTADRRLYRYQPQAVHALRSDGELFRKATVVTETNDLPASAQEMLALSWGMVHGVEDINGFNSLQPRRYTDYVFGPQENEVVRISSQSSAVPVGQSDPQLAQRAVRPCPCGGGGGFGLHLRLVFENADVRVYENTQAYPRAYFADHVRRELDPVDHSPTRHGPGLRWPRRGPGGEHNGTATSGFELARGVQSDSKFAE